jgi:uncharacterized protein (TIGR03437 family)
MLVAGALTSSAQAPANFTPDPYVAQITHSARDSFVGDTSANGRFVVIESNGDIATEKTATRNNQDSNREIFLFDYAQRRIFQLTDTKSVLKPAGSASPSPSPSPSPSVSPTASPTPTPVDINNVAIEISNNRPMISLEPLLVGGQRTYSIVFSSNAPTPASFDGTDPGAPANTDMNQEIWTYRFTVTDTADLTSGAELGPIDLTTGSFTQITNTPASRAPSPANSPQPPFVADDNRDATISDNGQIIAFISTRNFAGTPGFVGSANADANPEVFIFNRGTSAFTQVTNTTTTSVNFPLFSSNPAISSDGSVLTFVSNADLAAANTDLNAEVYLANYNTGTGQISGLKQVTRTKNDTTTNATTNLLTFGRRLSRDGKFLAFDSLASDPKTEGTINPFYVSFVYDVVADTFAQLGPRAAAAPGDPVLHVPVFTDYDAALRPASMLFTSALNFKSDGTFPATDQDSTGLNPGRGPQIFAASLPVISTGPFTRLTNLPTNLFAGVGAFPSKSRQRITFSRPYEVGGGNADGSIEAYYQLSVTPTTESTGTLTLFTGASLMSVPVASPTASPSVSPTPAASPTTPLGLAAGELAVAQSSVSLAPASVTVSAANASESGRAPALPIELSGVSVGINGVAAGLYAVSPSQIKFVVPIGLAAGTYPIVINNNGTAIRGVLTIVVAQPDIFTSTNGPGGRAKVCNVTNPATPSSICLGEPFNVTSDDGTGTQVPTKLRVFLTGVRGVSASAINVTVGTTVIVPAAAFFTDLPGTDNVDFILPSTVDRGDVPIVVSVGAAASRRTDNDPPKISINTTIAPLPIVNQYYLVWQQYDDFLGRAPDASGFNFWTEQILGCGGDAQCVDLKRTNVSAAFFLSVEFQQTGYLVYRTYKAAFGNIPGAPVPIRHEEFMPDKAQVANGVVVGQSGWQALLESNTQSYFSQFVQRSRFTSAFPTNLTPGQFVDALNNNAGGPLSASEKLTAVGLFNGALDTANTAVRAQVLRKVAEDQDLYNAEFNKAFVLMEYYGYLLRNPYDPPEATHDFSGFNFWLTKLNAHQGDYVKAEMVRSFLVSGEYRQRFEQ